MLSKAIAIASQAFEGKLDKAGQPYILHCLHVMNDVKHKPVEYQIVAVLHDLVEDTDWSFSELLNEGFDASVIEPLRCLTHTDGESYTDYIIRVSKNRVATRVKLADLKHNSDITRLKGIKDKDMDRIKKYNKSYMFLSKVYASIKETDAIVAEFGDGI